MANYEKIATDSLGFVFIGPSGSGKSTLRDALCAINGGDTRFVKYQHLTTRARRPRESDEYIFLDDNTFNRWRETDLVLFENESYGNRFMTLWPKKLPKNTYYLYILLPDAALELKKYLPNTKIIQILSDNNSNLRDVILQRDPNISSGELRDRIARAEAEIASGREIADDVFVNRMGIDQSAEDLRILIWKYILG